MENIVKQLGERIRSIRKAKGWSQDDLADASTVNQKYISELERGTVNGSIGIYYAIARGLGISLAELCDGLEAGRSGDELYIAFLRAAQLDEEKQRVLVAVINGFFKGIEG